MINPRSFRHMMGRFATGVTVVTTHTPQGEAVGLTVNSFTSVSLDPPLVSFCLDKKAHLFPVFRQAQFFAINILSENQINISQHFANHHRFPAPPRMWGRPQEGCPVLSKSLGWILCRMTATYKGGDHSIFLGEVIKMSKRSPDINPLLYFQSSYREIKG